MNGNIQDFAHKLNLKAKEKQTKPNRQKKQKNKMNTAAAAQHRKE